jgi:hypothetical protein
MSVHTIQLVDWYALEGAMMSMSRSRSIFVAKHNSGMCGVGKFMKRWWCGEEETASHVWHCRDHEASSVWQQAMNRLAIWLSSVQTSPDI